MSTFLAAVCSVTSVACGASPSPSQTATAAPTAQSPTPALLAPPSPTMYAEASERADAPGTFDYQLTIAASGAWAETANATTRDGVLGPAQLATLRGAIASVDRLAAHKDCRRASSAVTTITVRGWSATYAEACGAPEKLALLRHTARALVHTHRSSTMEPVDAGLGDRGCGDRASSVSAKRPRR